MLEDSLHFYQVFKSDFPHWYYSLWNSLIGTNLQIYLPKLSSQTVLSWEEMPSSSQRPSASERGGGLASFSTRSLLQAEGGPHSPTVKAVRPAEVSAQLSLRTGDTDHRQRLDAAWQVKRLRDSARKTNVQEPGSWKSSWGWFQRGVYPEE